jgi:uncharacterized protein (TIGR03067 family)
MYRFSCLVVVFALLAGCKREGDAPKPPGGDSKDGNPPPTQTADDTKEREKLEGTWLMVEADDIGGKKDMQDEVFKKMNTRWVFKGKQVTTYRNDDVQEDGTYTLDVGQTPKRFEMKAKQGYIAWRAIYEIDGDTMRLCAVFLNRGAKEPFPTEFKAKPKDDLAWFLYKFKKQP